VGHVEWLASGVVAPVKTRRGWHVFEAGTLGQPFAAVGELQITELGVVYAARDRMGWHVVIDGERGPSFRSIRAASIVVAFGRVLYVGKSDRGDHAVVDGRVGPGFRRVERLRLVGKGEHALYVAYDPDGASIVVDGTPGPIADAVHELAVSSRQPRWAAILERGGRLVLSRDGSETELPRGARGLVISTDGAHIAWVQPSAEGAVVWRDSEPGPAHVDVDHLAFVPGCDELLYVARTADGYRVVHDTLTSARFDTIEPPVTSPSGHWGFVARRGAGSLVVVDGEVRFRGEWSSAPVLAADGEGWAFVTRRGGRRFVMTPDGATEVARPFVDTLVLDAAGAHWAIAVADRRARELRVVVDGSAVAALTLDELAADVILGRDGSAAARALVASELARATRLNGR